MTSVSDRFILSNGYYIPCVGYGTWRTPDGEITENAVKSAIEAGYRHIDTASVYGNERSVGRAIAAAGIKRREIFVTSKLWNADRGYDRTMAAFEITLENLGLDYLDLYLIHWPASASRFADWEEINIETWQALMRLYRSGRVRAIGVSNFKPHHLSALMKAPIKPMVNQIEFHPGQRQSETLEFCKANEILVEAWSPLGSGRMLENETLAAIAKKYGRSVAQLCIRWCLQSGVLPLPKSLNEARMAHNAEVFDFSISEDDMRLIDAMEYCGGSGSDPDSVDF